MGLATPTTMGEQPNLDEFIRHLQAELELSESIVDPVEQEQRQWQIEASLQEAIAFSSRWKRIAELGKNPIKIVESIVKQEQQRARKHFRCLSTNRLSKVRKSVGIRS